MLYNEDNNTPNLMANSFSYTVMDNGELCLCCNGSCTSLSGCTIFVFALTSFLAKSSLWNSDFQPMCHGTLVCHEWSAGVPWDFRKIRGIGDVSHPSTAQCALLIIQKKMVLLDNFSALLRCFWVLCAFQLSWKRLKIIVLEALCLIRRRIWRGKRKSKMKAEILNTFSWE